MELTLPSSVMLYIYTCCIKPQTESNTVCSRHSCCLRCVTYLPAPLFLFPSPLTKRLAHCAEQQQQQEEGSFGPIESSCTGIRILSASYTRPGFLIFFFPPSPQTCLISIGVREWEGTPVPPLGFLACLTCAFEIDIKGETAKGHFFLLLFIPCDAPTMSPVAQPSLTIDCCYIRSSPVPRASNKPHIAGGKEEKQVPWPKNTRVWGRSESRGKHASQTTTACSGFLFLSSFFSLFSPLADLLSIRCSLAR